VTTYASQLRACRGRGTWPSHATYARQVPVPSTSTYARSKMKSKPRAWHRRPLNNLLQIKYSPAWAPVRAVRLCSARVTFGPSDVPTQPGEYRAKGPETCSLPCEKRRGEASTAAPGNATRQYKDTGTHVKPQVATLQDLKHIVVGGYALPCYDPGDAEQWIDSTTGGFRAYVIGTAPTMTETELGEVSEGRCTIRGSRDPRDRNPAIGPNIQD
jgi:hypothetical protein